jgi:hypothetical protein
MAASGGDECPAVGWTGGRSGFTPGRHGPPGRRSNGAIARMSTDLDDLHGQAGGLPPTSEQAPGRSAPSLAAAPPWSPCARVAPRLTRSRRWSSLGVGRRRGRGGGAGRSPPTAAHEHRSPAPAQAPLTDLWRGRLTRSAGPSTFASSLWRVPLQPRDLLTVKPEGHRHVCASRRRRPLVPTRAARGAGDRA